MIRSIFNNCNGSYLFRRFHKGRQSFLVLPPKIIKNERLVKEVFGSTANYYYEGTWWVWNALYDMKACISRSTSLAENKSKTSHMYIYNKVKVLQNHETCDTIWKYKTKHKETRSRFRIQWIWILIFLAWQLRDFCNCEKVQVFIYSAI